MGMTLKPRDVSLPCAPSVIPVGGMNRSYPLTASATVPGFFSYARPVRHRKIRDVDTELYHMTSRVSRAD